MRPDRGTQAVVVGSLRRYNTRVTPTISNLETRSRWLGVAALLVCATFWSLNGPLIKLLDQEEVPGLTIACYRSLLGGIVFLPVAWSRIHTIRRVRLAWPIAGVISFTIMTLSFVLANTAGPAANAILLQYTSPLWVFLLAPYLLREKARLTDGLVLVTMLAGVSVIFAGAPAGNALAIGLGLISGFGYGTLTVILRGLRPVQPAVVAAINAFGSGIILAVPMFIERQAALSLHAWMLMLLLALVQFTLPYVLFSWALQRVGAHAAALILLLEPVLNPIWTWIAVGEVPPSATFIGGPLIFLGVVAWIVLGTRRARGMVAAARLAEVPPDTPPNP